MPELKVGKTLEFIKHLSRYLHFIVFNDTNEDQTRGL